MRRSRRSTCRQKKCARKIVSSRLDHERRTPTNRMPRLAREPSSEKGSSKWQLREKNFAPAAAAARCMPAVCGENVLFHTKNAFAEMPCKCSRIKLQQHCAKLLFHKSVSREQACKKSMGVSMHHTHFAWLRVLIPDQHALLTFTCATSLCCKTDCIKLLLLLCRNV